MAKKKRKSVVPTNPRDAADVGFKQAEHIVASLLFDKFGFSAEKIIKLMFAMEELSHDLYNNKELQHKIGDWGEKHNLIIDFHENTSFMTKEARYALNFKIGLKVNTCLHMMYVLKYKFRFTYKNLGDLKFYIEDLQDSIDKRYLTYEDIYAESKERDYLC